MYANKARTFWNTPANRRRPHLWNRVFAIWYVQRNESRTRRQPEWLRPIPVNEFVEYNISTAQVDANSANIINFIGATVTLHPDFGAGTFHNQTLGIPYQVVAGTQTKVPVTLGAYFDESDPGPEPIPANALIEGYPKPGNGDRHVLVLEKDGCWLYELYNASVKSGKWSTDATAIWDMTINEQRPYTWTSADAAGLPVFVGLARYDEVAAGAINHALRFTVPTSQKAFVLPATHWASTTTNTSAPPMGTRLRLKASFNISTYPADDQVILTALKKYGMILADNGSAIFISGVPDKSLEQYQSQPAEKYYRLELRNCATGHHLHARQRADWSFANHQQF